MSATLRLTREGVGIELRRGPFEIAVDGGSVGSIKRHETFEMPLEPGHASSGYGQADTRAETICGIELPAIRSREKQIVSPERAHELIAALPQRDRPLWATALFAGLRRGELRALRWDDVDLDGGVIRVQRGWDATEGEIAPKSAKGKRTVPIAGVLRGHLTDHWLRGGTGSLVFGEGGKPFRGETPLIRARAAWTAAGLESITLHECRHTFASLMIAAGVNAKSLSTYMGHANIATTFDLYGHLMPGNESDAAVLLDTYLARDA